VSTLPQVIWASLFNLAFVAVAHCAPDSVVTKEVIALREAVPAMNDGKSVGSMVDILAPLQMRVIGGNDATWKRDNPNWIPVLTLIREDLKKDLEPALKAQAADDAVRWNHELASHLSAAEVDELLSFYRSDTGRRYLAFQRCLIAIQEEGSAEIMATFASGGRDPKAVDEPEPSPAQLDARKKLVALSWADKVTPELGASVSPSHGASASDDKVIADMMNEIVATRRGTELDALLAQYQDDFAAFSAFHASPAAKALLAVYGHVARDAAAEPVKPGAGFKTALDQSVARHTPAWKAAYEAGRVSAH
jgi:hypothetical protein